VCVCVQMYCAHDVINYVSSTFCDAFIPAVYTRGGGGGGGERGGSAYSRS